MSAISNFINTIRNAVYGEQVRGAIVSALEQCYSDVNSPSLQTEAFTAALNAAYAGGILDIQTVTQISAMTNQAIIYRYNGTQAGYQKGLYYYSALTSSWVLIGSEIHSVSNSSQMTDTNSIYKYTGTQSGMVQNSLYCYNGTAWVPIGSGVLTASAKSQMTNTNAIYKYTGTESGMVQNRLYYYDGTDWKQVASDSHSNLVNLSGKITSGYGIVIRNNAVTVSNGKIAKVSEDAWSCAVFPCYEGDSFTVTGTGGSADYRLYAFVGELGTSNASCIEVCDATSSANGQTKTITAPEGTAYVVFNFRSANTIELYGAPTNSNLNDVITEVSTKSEMTNKNAIYKYTGTETDMVQNGVYIYDGTDWKQVAFDDNGLSDLSGSIVYNKAVNISESGGTYTVPVTSSGGIARETANSWGSVVLLCNEGDSFTITGTGGSGNYRLYAFVGELETSSAGTSTASCIEVCDSATSSAGIVNTVVTAPEGAKYAVFNFNTKKTIAIYSGSDVEEEYTDHIKFLVIGNSYACDSMAYVPFILKQFRISCEIYLYDRGALSLRDVYNRWESSAASDVEYDGVHADTYSRYLYHINTKNDTNWWSITRASIKDLVSQGGWDFITLQQWSAYSIDPNTYAPWLDLDIELINNEIKGENTPLAWLQVWTRKAYDDKQASISTFENTVVGGNYPFEFYIPCGTAIFNARENPDIAQLGGGGDLWTSDNVHLQEGLGCYIASLTIVESIFRKFFPDKSVMFDNTTIGDNTSGWNIPERQLPIVGMTEKNRLAAKYAVISACNHPFEILAANYPPYVEYASISSFPSQGESGILYKALDTGNTYTWSGSEYTLNKTS